MKKKIIPLVLALGFAASLLNAQDSPPNGGPPPPPRPAASPGLKMRILPPGAVERLDLTADQYGQVLALEAEVNAKLAKILTPEQVQQLERMRSMGHRGGPGGPGGRGGPGGGGDNRPPPPPPPGP